MEHGGGTDELGGGDIGEELLNVVEVEGGEVSGGGEHGGGWWFLVKETGRRESGGGGERRVTGIEGLGGCVVAKVP